MKKKLGIILAILLCVVLVFTLVACKKNNNNSTTNNGGDGSSSAALEGVDDTQIASVEGKLQSYLNTWVSTHATEEEEDQKSLLNSDLKAQKSQFKLNGTKDSFSPTFTVTFKDGKYTVKASWGEGKVSKTLTVDAVTVTYTNWSGNHSRTADYDYLEDRNAVADTLDTITVAFLNTVNKITGNAVTGKFGMDGLIGFDAFGANYALRVKGNVDTKNKTGNEIGLVIENSAGKEMAGLYYKSAESAKDSKVYIQYLTEDKAGNEITAYKYLEYADVLALVNYLLTDADGNSIVKDKAGKGVFTYTDKDGKAIEITGIAEWLEQLGLSNTVSGMVPNIAGLLAKAYADDDGRYLIDINLAEVLTKVTDLLGMLGDVDLSILKEIGLDLKTMHGLFGHISISAQVTGDDVDNYELSDFELAVNIPQGTTFYFTADESANATKFDLPSIGFAIYLEDFKFLTSGTVKNVIPAKALTEAKYFSPTNLDLSGDVYVNHVAGEEETIDSTFHFEFVTDVNPLEIIENGFSSNARAALVVKQHDGDVAYTDANKADWSNFLSVSYEQKTKLLTVRGTAFGLEDDGNVLYTCTLGESTLDDIKMWLGLTNWIGLEFDADEGITINNEKENGPAKPSAQAIFGDKLVQELVKYYLAQKAEKNEAQDNESSAEVAEASVIDEVGDYFDGIKAIYDKLIEEGVIKVSGDPVSFSLNVTDSTVADVIKAINDLFGTEIKATDKAIADLKIVKVEANTEGYEDKVYIKVQYGDNTYELTFDDSKDKKFLITFVMTLKSNRSYTVVFDATSGINTWSASVLFDIKDDKGAAVDHTEVTLSNFHGEWGNDNVSEVEALLDEIKDVETQDVIFPTDGTGPATKLAEGLLKILSSDKVYDATSYLGKFIIRQVV